MPPPPDTATWDLVFTAELSDYVTGLAWSEADILAVCSAAGEVGLCDGATLTLIKPADQQSLSWVGFSADGQYLATAGQAGDVIIWHISVDPQIQARLITTLRNPGIWIDYLAWHPTRSELAIGLTHYVQIWDAVEGCVVATLDFAASSVLGLAWGPQGDYLAVGGYQGINVWAAADWDEEPQHLPLMSACVGLAWSGDGAYIAATNIDRTLAVWAWGEPEPWTMRGFPGKVTQLVWSSPLSSHESPQLACCCAAGIVLWEQDQAAGWSSRILDEHQQTMIAIGFQPGSLLLASAGAEGWLCLWQAQEVSTILTGVKAGCSGLAWNLSGTLLATGGQAGEVLVWQQSS